MFVYFFLIRKNELSSIKRELKKTVTKEGNVILLSADEYNSLIESLYLAGIKGVYEDIEEAVKTPTSEFSKEPPWK